MSINHAAETWHAPRPVTTTDHAAGPAPEALAARLRRYALGTAWGLKPPRHKHAPAIALMMARHYLKSKAGRRRLPDPERTLDTPEGQAGVCDDLGVDTLAAGHRIGLYTVSHFAPMLWYSPPRRMVAQLEGFHIQRSLRRKIRNARFTVTFDTDPLGVMQGCAAPREGRLPLTWITPRMMKAQLALHRAGHMHSVEVWDGDGRLAGGLFGVAMGPVFTMYSMFAAVPDAAKFGMAVCNAHLQHWGFKLADGMLPTWHTEMLGFKLIPRSEFRAILQGAATPGPAGRWSIDERLDVGAWEPASGRVPLKATAAPAAQGSARSTAAPAGA